MSKLSQIDPSAYSNEMCEHARTKYAVKLSTDSDPRHAEWFPLSQIEMEETDRENIFIVTVPEWLAKEKFLI